MTLSTSQHLIVSVFFYLSLTLKRPPKGRAYETFIWRYESQFDNFVDLFWIGITHLKETL